MYISYDILMPGKDVDKLLGNIIVDIDEDVVYSFINYADLENERPLEAYIVTKQEYSIKIFRLVPKYSIYNEHLRGLKINDMSIFDVSSQEVSVFLSEDDISSKEPQFVESFANSPKFIASITPDRYGHYSRMLLFGIKKEDNSSSYLPNNGVKLTDTKELYKNPLGKEKIFVVEELKFNGVPMFLSKDIFNVWNYYKGNE